MSKEERKIQCDCKIWETEEDIFDTVEKLYIPKFIIRDKIKEYKNLLKTCNKKEDIERIKGLNERILVLEEIIEGEK